MNTKSTKGTLAGERISKLLSKGALIIIFLVMVIALWIATEGLFVSGKNIYNVLRQTSINGIVAIGMTFVIIAGGIDLSVGSVVGFSAMAAALLMKEDGIGLPVMVAVLLALAASALLGVINGFVTYKGKVPPFIATLGMMTVVRAVIMLISGAAMVAGLPKSFVDFSQTDIFGFFPSMVLVWIIVIAVSWFIIKFTIFGRNVYAIGSNIESSRLSGVNIGRVTVGVYALGSFFSGVAGILFASRIGNGVPTGGQGYELEAIAAAVIGGASLSGAEGSIFGTVLGAMIMQILRNGGNLLGVNPFIMDIIIGTLIVVTVLIDQSNKKRRV